MKKILLFLLLFSFSSLYAQRETFTIKKIHFQAHADISAVFTNKYSNDGYITNTLRLAGPSIDLTIGARITKYFYWGFGLGYHTLMTKAFMDIPSNYPPSRLPVARTIEDVSTSVLFSEVLDYNHYMPIFTNLKIYWPISYKFLPFIDTSIGGYVGFHERAFYEVNNYAYNYKAMKLANGFYMRAGLGVDIMRFNIGIGYELLSNRIGNEHIGYVKLGWKIG